MKFRGMPESLQTRPDGTFPDNHIANPARSHQLPGPDQQQAATPTGRRTRDSRGEEARPRGTREREDVVLATATRAAPATTGTGAARLADQANREWVIPHDQLACAEIVKRACAAAGFERKVVAEASDFSVQLQLVAAGIGVALVPRLAARALPDGLLLLRVDPRSTGTATRSPGAPPAAIPGSAGSSNCSRTTPPAALLSPDSVNERQHPRLAVTLLRMPRLTTSPLAARSLVVGRTLIGHRRPYPLVMAEAGRVAMSSTFAGSGLSGRGRRNR